MANKHSQRLHPFLPNVTISVIRLHASNILRKINAWLFNRKKNIYTASITNISKAESPMSEEGY